MRCRKHLATCIYHFICNVVILINITCVHIVTSNIPPRFSPIPSSSGSEIVVIVREGPVSVGKEILRLSGEDPDGDNLTFGVQGSPGNDLLRIENNVPIRNSAIVYLKRELDRETNDSYSFILTLTDGKLGRGKFVTKTMLIIVQDTNDNDPVFKPFAASISIPENTEPFTVIESVEAYDLDEGRFGQVIYRLQEVNKSPDDDSETFRIETVDSKGIIRLVKRVDYEKKSSHRLMIVATDLGVEESQRSATAFLTVNIKDINDNAPVFSKKIYTGGVSTDADYGTIVMQVKAIDLDSSVNGEVRYYINGTIRRKLSIGMDSLRIDPFILNKRTGEISLNFDPQRGMKGYFEFDLIANDSAGLKDTARATIYLLREDQRVRFVLRLSPSELREKLDKFLDVLSNITGAIVNVDSYKFHETFDGNVDKRRTDLYLHFVDRKDNSILEVDSVLTLIDKNSDYLDELYKEFNVLLSEPAVDRQDHLIWEDQVKACLIGTSAFLALLLILVTCLCLSQRIRYERLLKAATTPTSCFQDRQLSRANVPNTNIHADEGSNPIWMTGYDNEWYEKEDEQISDRSGGNSLDENAVTEVTGSEGEPTTPTDSLNGSGRCSDSTKNDKHCLSAPIGPPNSISGGAGGGGVGGITSTGTNVTNGLSSRHLTSASKMMILPSSNSHKSSPSSSSSPQSHVKPNNNNNSTRQMHSNHHHQHSMYQQQTPHSHQQQQQHSAFTSTSGSKKLTAPRPPISMPMPISSTHSTLKSLTVDANINNGNLMSHNTLQSANDCNVNTVQTSLDVSNHHEVTCKNSINTIYISSNSFKDASQSQVSPVTTSGPSNQLSSQPANNLSIISLETTEL